jgi:predicted transcriptional regulator
MYYDVLRITDAEMKIMKALWSARRPLKVAEIEAHLVAAAEYPADSARPADRATLAEQLRRLEAKSAVILIKTGKINSYICRFPEPLYNAVLLKNLKQTRFAGSLAEMVRLMLCDMDLTSQDIDEVKEMVDHAAQARAEDTAEAAEAIDEEPGGLAEAVETGEKSRQANGRGCKNHCVRVSRPYGRQAMQSLQMRLLLQTRVWLSPVGKYTGAVPRAG